MDQALERPDASDDSFYSHLREGRVILRDATGAQIDPPEGTVLQFESQLVGWISDRYSIEHMVGYPRAAYHRGRDGAELQFENGPRIRLDQLSGNHRLTLVHRP